MGFNHLLGEMPLQSKSVAQTTIEINEFLSHRHQSNDLTKGTASRAAAHLQVQTTPLHQIKQVNKNTQSQKQLALLKKTQI